MPYTGTVRCGAYRLCTLRGHRLLQKSVNTNGRFTSGFVRGTIDTILAWATGTRRWDKLSAKFLLYVLLYQKSVRSLHSEMCWVRCRSKIASACQGGELCKLSLAYGHGPLKICSLGEEERWPWPRFPQERLAAHICTYLHRSHIRSVIPRKMCLIPYHLETAEPFQN